MATLNTDQDSNSSDHLTSVVRIIQQSSSGLLMHESGAKVSITNHDHRVAMLNALFNTMPPTTTTTKTWKRVAKKTSQNFASFACIINSFISINVTNHTFMILSVPKNSFPYRLRQSWNEFLKVGIGFRSPNSKHIKYTPKIYYAQNSLKGKIKVIYFFSFSCPNIRGRGYCQLDQIPNLTHFCPFEGSPQQNWQCTAKVVCVALKCSLFPCLVSPSCCCCCSAQIKEAIFFGSTQSRDGAGDPICTPSCI